MSAPARTQNGDPKVGLLRNALDRMRPKMADVLPKHLTPDRMARLALLAFNRQPELQNCSVESLVEAVMIISAWGLEIGRTAHIVAFGGKATAIADYKGKIELAIRAGTVRAVDVRLVRENDDFYVEYGLDEKLVHRPHWQEKGAVIGAYAIARLARGGAKFDLMNRDELEGIRNRSKAKNNGPWRTDENEMFKKTVVHRLLKTVPWSNELADAIEADDMLGVVDEDDGFVPIAGGPRIKAGSGPAARVVRPTEGQYGNTTLPPLPKREPGEEPEPLGGEEIEDDRDTDQAIAADDRKRGR